MQILGSVKVSWLFGGPLDSKESDGLELRLVLRKRGGIFIGVSRSGMSVEWWRFENRPSIAPVNQSGANLPKYDFDALVKRPPKSLTFDQLKWLYGSSSRRKRVLELLGEEAVAQGHELYQSHRQRKKMLVAGPMAQWTTPSQH